MTHIDQTIRSDGKYVLHAPISYTSPRYKKTVTVQPGVYDGATGAIDINSASWWVHDQLCNTGQWDDGTKVSNWVCSQVLQDILMAEGRWARARYWFWTTWLFGGGKARLNGLIALTLCLVLQGCTTVSVTAGCNSVVDIQTDRVVTTEAGGNTLPIGGLP